MFSFIKKKLTKIYNQFTSKASALFSKNVVDEAFFNELHELLIYSDTGLSTTNEIMQFLKDEIKTKRIDKPEEIKIALKKQLVEKLNTSKKVSPSAKASPSVKASLDYAPPVLLLVGINGSGKTTFAAKFANKLKNEGKKVLLVAADTFRAAATEQLSEWGEKVGVDVLTSKKEGQDPASVVFDGCQKYQDENYDHIIIDTAGRLQTKTNLMKELEKIKRIILKKIKASPSAKVSPSMNETTIHTWLTIDSMLGQNSFEQAKIFNEATNLDGIILTKLDGTGKGGIVFSITNQLHLPIAYVTFGEEIDSLKTFDANNYVEDLLG